MPRLEWSDFPGDTDDEKKANCYQAFTVRQKERLEHLRDPVRNKITSTSIWIPKWDYREWVELDPAHEVIHDELEILQAKADAERDAKKARNKATGIAMAIKDNPGVGAAFSNLKRTANMTAATEPKISKPDSTELAGQPKLTFCQHRLGRRRRLRRLRRRRRRSRRGRRRPRRLRANHPRLPHLQPHLWSPRQPWTSQL